MLGSNIFFRSMQVEGANTGLRGMGAPVSAGFNAGIPIQEEKEGR